TVGVSIVPDDRATSLVAWHRQWQTCCLQWMLLRCRHDLRVKVLDEPRFFPDTRKLPGSSHRLIAPPHHDSSMEMQTTLPILVYVAKFLLKGRRHPVALQRWVSAWLKPSRANTDGSRHRTKRASEVLRRIATGSPAAVVLVTEPRRPPPRCRVTSPNPKSLP